MSDIRRMGINDWLSLSVLSVLWGGSFFFIEIALTGLPLFVIVFLRVCIGALLLLLFTRLRSIRIPRDKKIWLSFLVMGILNNVIPFSLIVWGQKSINGGLASLLNASTPFFTVIAAHHFTSDEKLNPRKLTGILAGFAGVSVLIGVESVKSGENLPAGQLAVLGASISYAFAGIWGRRFKKLGVNPLATSTGQLSCSALILLPVMLIVEKPWNLSFPAPEVWAAIGGISLLSTAVAYNLYFRILSSSGATNVLLVTFIIPVSAILLGFLFLDEQVFIRQFIGMGIIGMGLIAIDGRLFKFDRNKTSLKR